MENSSNLCTQYIHVYIVNYNGKLEMTICIIRLSETFRYLCFLLHFFCVPTSEDDKVGNQSLSFDLMPL